MPKVHVPIYLYFSYPSKSLGISIGIFSLFNTLGRKGF